MHSEKFMLNLQFIFYTNYIKVIFIVIKLLNLFIYLLCWFLPFFLLLILLSIVRKASPVHTFTVTHFCTQNNIYFLLIFHISGFAAFVLNKPLSSCLSKTPCILAHEERTLGQDFLFPAPTTYIAAHSSCFAFPLYSVSNQPESFTGNFGKIGRGQELLSCREAGKLV